MVLMININNIEKKINWGNPAQAEQKRRPVSIFRVTSEFDFNKFEHVFIKGITM